MNLYILTDKFSKKLNEKESWRCMPRTWSELWKYLKYTSETWFPLRGREGKEISKRGNKATNDSSQTVIFEKSYWNKEKFKVVSLYHIFILSNMLINFKLMNLATSAADV